MTTNRRIVLGSLLSGLIVVSTIGPARAGGCPVGMVQTGSPEAGWESCVPLPGYGGEEEDAGWNDSPPWRQLTPQEQADYDQYIREGGEAYDRLHDGAWDYRQWSDPEGRAICEARFSKMGESVALRAARGPGGVAMLTFRGEKVPHPRQPKPIRVKLVQGAEAAQVVTAYSDTQPDIDAYHDGVLTFTVPSVEALLASMDDTQPFKVQDGGRTLVDLQWHHGREAREALSQCLRGR